MTLHSRRLSTQILASQLAVLILAFGVGLGFYLLSLRRSLDRQYGQAALIVANAAAAEPAIREAMAAGDPNHTVARLAEQMRRATGAAYVVVLDLNRVRHSHPNAALIGQKVSEPLIALDGHGHIGIDQGSLGRSANGKAPLRAPDGRIIGEVSAGFLESRASAQLWADLPNLLGYTGVALALGVLASVLLARRLKRQTFGLELDELSNLLQEREAMLHGIREGVLTTDPAGLISLANDEALRLLHLTEDAIGLRLADVGLPTRLRGLLTGHGSTHEDAVLLNDGACLSVSKMEVDHKGRRLGSVITLRDRTETVELLREMDSISSLADALRAQQHEHANRIHTLVGLMNLGYFDEATNYARELFETPAIIAESLRDQVTDPTVLAVLLAKHTIAREAGVRLTIENPGLLNDLEIDSRVVVSVLGNLVDNAVEAARSRLDAWVTVRCARPDPLHVQVAVVDSGPGVPPGAPVFEDGFSTKSARPGVHRGLGPALVHRFVVQAGGSITVHNDGGAVFTVVLPARARAVLDW